MKPEQRFLQQPKHFWANVRSLSQHIGYTNRKTKQVLAPGRVQILDALQELDLSAHHLFSNDGDTTLGKDLLEYFKFRAQLINNVVRPNLQDAEAARAMYERVLKKTGSKRSPVMNKQKGKKRKPAYLTCTIDLLLETSLGDHHCDFSPRELTTFTQGGAPLRTLARWVDGAFPSAKNPVAVWEIKEYYHTTTFGSRVADGVYESLLDGMEIEELTQSERIECKHYLIIDAHYTWWDCGRSYLCRIVDMLHMGYIDELLVGKEVESRIPELVQEWIALLESRPK